MAKINLSNLAKLAKVIFGLEGSQSLECRTGNRGVMGSNPASAGATSLRNFGNSAYPTLPVSFAGDTKSRQSLLSVSMPGEVNDPTMCNLSGIPQLR